MSTAFLPGAVAALTDEQAGTLAADARLRAGWQQYERERIASDFLAFVEGYGSVEPATGAIPFTPWEAQREVMEALDAHQGVIVLKARQLGLSWIALHRAVWLAAYAQGAEGARVLIACKNQEDASNQLRRARRIIERLPEWLRPELGADSATRLDFPGRGGASIRVLTANPEAIRGETASLVIWDEAAFSKNATAPAIWTALLPAVEQGSLIVISTGNGRTGDGAQFAELWDAAAEGRSDLHPVFLPWSAHPDRDEAWAERTRARMGDDDAFRQEYPAEPGDAFAARVDQAVYPPAHIAAAVKLGAEAEQVEGPVELGADWGDVQTAGVYLRPLEAEGGGVHIVRELVQSRVEPRRAALALFEEAAHRYGALGEFACDAAPAGTVRTAEEVLDELYRAEPQRFPDSFTRVPFGRFKEGGGDSRGVNTVGYIRWLLHNTAHAAETGEIIGPRIAIDAEACPVLVAQMKALVRDARGRVAKPPLDPKRPERGDHCCDALVAALAGRALTRWQSRDEDAGEHGQRQQEVAPDSAWRSVE